MKNYDQSVETHYNPNCSYIFDHPYRTLIIRVSGSDKINELLNLINDQRPDIDKIYLYVKDSIRNKISIAC